MISHFLSSVVRDIKNVDVPPSSLLQIDIFKPDGHFDNGPTLLQAIKN
ncbi:hypothetical protein AAW51_0403 [Caldimonas brevitalea]|uniref:Uncharacterized protein n=1 Tax=Caldimonas brevitalea TaxID=413882 RepID=A0A0G3BCJ8_9BURK|nr:hypothetical protein AAW51_0403 [Caldimonas brevitalea]